jgi:hypothetical protein
LTPSLPQKVDLRQYGGDIENQLTVNSCVANATVSALEILLTKAGKFRHLSRLFLYWDCRASYANLRGVDSGSYLSDGFKSVYKVGIPAEAVWPYVSAQVNVQPPEPVYADALGHKVGAYQRVGDFQKASTAQWSLEMVKTTLAMGYPVTIAMWVSNRIFEITATDNLYDPVGVGMFNNVGGHAMCIVGYDETQQAFIVENSWGTAWGNQGYFLISYRALTEGCFDAWTCSDFDGTTFAPEWHFLPNPPLTATLGSVPTQYKATKDAQFVFAPPLPIQINGGVGPFTYAWKASDSSALINPNGNATVMVSPGWAAGEQRSIIVTCTISDCSVPTQQTTTAQTVLRVVNAVEDKGPVYRLYRAAFGRTPDPAGQAYWEGILLTHDLPTIAQAFMASAEWLNMYGNTTDTQFVTLLYRNVLHREPDVGGLGYWVGLLATDPRRDSVLINFSESAENKAN